MMLNIVIKTIPHRQQRYDTVGDWVLEGYPPIISIFVSQLGDWRMEAAVGIHELVEAMLCYFVGISQAQVDTFDQTYESKFGEPGDDPKAPYHVQHSIASGIERIVLTMLGVNWKEYGERIDQCQKPDSTSSASRGTALGSLIDS